VFIGVLTEVLTIESVAVGINITFPKKIIDIIIANTAKPFLISFTAKLVEISFMNSLADKKLFHSSLIC
jgi:hypothetical protein